MDRDSAERRWLSSVITGNIWPRGFTADGRHLVRPTVDGGGEAIFDVWSLPEGRLEHTLELPGKAWLVGDRLLTVVEVSREAHRRAMQRCAELGLRSGAVFDAVHPVCAEISGADALVTFNPADFTRLAAGGTPAVIVPPDPPGFVLPRP